MGKKILVSVVSLALVGLAFVQIAPPLIEKSLNQVEPSVEAPVSQAVLDFHNSLLVGDLHADSLLWNRDLLQRSDRGHVDFPRLREGNVALQMLTTVTKSPKGQNIHANEAGASDNITSLVISQAWPVGTWQDLSERALYQAQKLHEFVARAPDEVALVQSQGDLEVLLAERAAGKSVVGALLGTEGSHALSGELANIDRLFDAGFRMMSLQHFFDNKLGGSLHGKSKQGLTSFGRDAVNQMLKLGIMIDVAHSSEAVVRDVLTLSGGPVIVSHTGFRGHCDSSRNISDELMKAIAAQGGLIGVGYWKQAICDISAAGVAEAIVYGVNLVGEDAVALGSDYDGTVITSFDTSKLHLITAALLEQGLSEEQVRKVMGGNMVRYLADNLPEV